MEKLKKFWSWCLSVIVLKIEQLKKKWPWYLSSVVLIVAGIFYKTSPNMETTAQVGDFFSGISATLAFIWLIAGFILQTRELGLQRVSLDLQRE